MIELAWESWAKRIEAARVVRGVGKVKGITGLKIEAIGPEVALGEVCMVQSRGNDNILAEVVGFRSEVVELMPYGSMQGISPGAKVISMGRGLMARVGNGMLGRVIDPLGNPLDKLGPLDSSEVREIDCEPPDPISRPRIQEMLPLGIRSIDSCITCGKGQRIGVFAGSGVGKSTLMGMIARNTQADVNVIALIGERGREVREFIETALGEEGLARSVVVVATSSEPAVVRLKGAYVATAIAEYFRDQGKDVMLMMDSVTRFALAQREIGLAVGEPPTTRGYTPSVFAMLPRLFERAGPAPLGTITGFYTVLVEGGDLDEPVADAVRGLLDGHIVMSREMAQLGHFPAIDVLASVSRLINEITSDSHKKHQVALREILSVYRQAKDLIDIGAYQSGSNPRIDRAISKHEMIQAFLRQSTEEKVPLEEVLTRMARIVQ